MTEESIYYSVHKIENMGHIREVFSEGYSPQYNWLFLSTSGVHGTYTTLDDIEENWDNNDEEDDDYCGHTITVLIFQPRIVHSMYGHIEIEKEDIPFLRSIVKKTLEAIEDSQWENI